MNAIVGLVLRILLFIGLYAFLGTAVWLPGRISPVPDCAAA